MSEVRLSTVIMVCVAFGVATYAVNSGSAAAENIWRKVKLASIGAVHMMFSKDKKFKPEVCTYTYTVIRYTWYRSSISFHSCQILPPQKRVL